MGKRTRDKGKEKHDEYLRKKIRKLKDRIKDKRLEDDLSPSPSCSRSTSPRLPHPSTSRSSLKEAQRHQSPPPPTPRSVTPQSSPSLSPSISPSPSPPPPPPPPRRTSRVRLPEVTRRPLPPSPSSSPPQEIEPNTEKEDEELPEEFLKALGTEGEEKIEVGEPIRSELAARWKKIMNEGLGKEAKEALIKKYPTPANFSAAVAPVMNPEILATLSEPSIKRDKRIISRQNLTGVLMTCLGKSLTSILKGNINSKILIEEINDAAKLAAEIHHLDSSSRKFFSMAGANKTVQDAVRQSQIDKYLFGENCAEKIKAAQAIKKNSNNIKNTEKKLPGPVPPNNKKAKQLNWKGPPQYQQPHRVRGGQQHQAPRKHFNQPLRKERPAASFKQRPRHAYRR